MDNQDNSPQEESELSPHEAMKARQELSEDNAPPAAPPSGVQDRIDDTHPSTDANIDEHERYDEGIEGAANIDLPGNSADEGSQPPPRV